MPHIIKLDDTMTPTHVFRVVAMTRSRRSSNCLIEPSDKLAFRVFGTGRGMPFKLSPKNELLLAHLRGEQDFQEQLVDSEYHSKTKTKKPKADSKCSRAIDARTRWPDRRPQAH